MLTREDIEQIGDWLKGPTLGRLIEQIEERYVETWKTAKTTEEREECWRMIKCLRGLVDEMTRLTSAPKVDLHNASRARANNWKMPKPEERPG